MLFFKRNILFFYKTLLFSTFLGFPLATLGALKPYPYGDSWTATLSYALIKPTNSNYIGYQESLHPERDDLNELVAANNFVQLNVFLSAKKDAPLVFILPGIGSNGDEKGAAFLGEKLNSIGYSVVTFPSTFSSSFALAVSETGVPGYAPQDSKDLYKLMHRIVDRLKKNQLLNPQSYNLFGYSLGARDAVFIQNLDLKAETDRFEFKNIYLINPPMSLPAGMAALDSYYQIGLPWTTDQKSHLIDQVMESYKQLLKREMNEDVFYNLENDFRVDGSPLPLSQRKWLIGNSFHESLASVFFSIEDLDILNLDGFELL